MHRQIFGHFVVACSKFSLKFPMPHSTRNFEISIALFTSWTFHLINITEHEIYFEHDHDSPPGTFSCEAYYELKCDFTRST